MKKKSLIFSILATIFTAGGIGSYFLYWIFQVEPGLAGGNFGYEVALNFDGSNKNMLAFGGLVFLVIAFLTSLVWMIVKIANRKKEVDPNKVAKNGRAIFVLVIATLICFLPLIGSASAMAVYGVANDTFAMPDPSTPYPVTDPSSVVMVLYGYFMGPGIPLTAVCSVLGGVFFYYAYSGFVD